MLNDNTYRYPFSFFPTGWFRVGYSRELPSGKVMPIKYFGQDLVLFRTEHGEVSLLDAHCPHLGAHLGHGGCVVGESIRCPLHGWRFDQSGKCVEVPYSGQLPRVTVRSWRVMEVGGIIFAYYQQDGEEPDWLVPSHPEFSSPEWTRLKTLKTWRVRAHVQELNENGVDLAHYTTLHGRAFAGTANDSVEEQGPWLQFRMTPQYHTRRLLGFFSTQASGDLEITYYGLGFAVAKVHTRSTINLNFLVMTMLTPIDTEYMELHVALAVRKLGYPLLTRLVTSRIIKETTSAIEMDIPIMEHKAYLKSPVLCHGDGQIMTFRRWARQFYPSTDHLWNAACGAGGSIKPGA